jgi:superfamily II DNA helicase RecQ
MTGFWLGAIVASSIGPLRANAQFKNGSEYETVIRQEQHRLRERLRERFGFQRFRPGQAEAVTSALNGRDAIVVMPTGSGKSLDLVNAYHTVKRLSRNCRWRFLLEYFGSDELQDAACGHCDRCT